MIIAKGTLFICSFERDGNGGVDYKYGRVKGQPTGSYVYFKK